MSEHDSTLEPMEKKNIIFVSPEQEADQLIETFFMPSAEDRKWAKAKIPSARLHRTDSYKDAVNASIICVDIFLKSIPDIFGVRPHIAISGLEKLKQILIDKIK